MTQDPFVGAAIDRWRVIGPLGQGGIGKVYRAEASDGSGQGKAVALKVLQTELVLDDQSRERFQREARALNGLRHPNIVEVLDYGIAHGAPYLVMELLDGMPLDAFVEQYHPPPRLALELARDLLSGLAYAHGLGVVHRDMKTENVFVTRAFDGRYRAKLLDFGLAKFTDEERWGTDKKLTAFGTVLGSPAYMPPEQALGGKADTRSDVYSTGVILFELLTGTWPFVGETQSEMLKLHLTAPVPKLASAKTGIDVPPELDEIIAKAMAKESPHRFTDANEMLAALEGVLARMAPAPASQPPMMAASKSVPIPLPPAKEERPGWVVALMIVGVLGGMAMLVIAAAVVAMFLLAGCGTGHSLPPEEAAATGRPPAGDPAREDGEEVEPGGADAASTWLRDLGQGETLTYHVTLQDGREADVRFRISDVVRRGDGVAVRLNPIGTPLMDSPVFARWIVADADTLYGLEETASLTQPGFEPLDARGVIVTEARDAITWRVELSWADGSATSMIGAGAIEGGWRVDGHQQSVEGAVRGARCVRLRRQEGETNTRMLICANLGLVELSRTGGDESDAQSWRLVDVGALSEEML